MVQENKASLEDARLAVTPEMLVSKAHSVEQYVARLRHKLKDMNDKVSRTSVYWLGDAGEAYRRKYNSYNDDIAVMLRRVSEYVSDLRLMAAVYEGAEKDNESLMSSLPEDVIY